MMTRGLLALVVVLAGTIAAAAPRSPSDPELEKRFRADVERVSAEAAAAFDRANAAREADRPDEAIAEYKKAIELAPGVDHPHRRLCSVYMRVNRVEEAVAACEKALSIAPDSPYDKTAISPVLVMRKGPGDVERAVKLSREAADALPNDVTALQAWCGVLVQSRNTLFLHDCVDRLLAVDPDGLAANFLGTLVSAEGRDFDEARVRLRKAKQAGLDQATYDDLSKKLDAFEEEAATFPAWVRTACWGGLWVIAIWLGVMALLLVGGFVLSRMTLAEVNRVTARGADATGSERERRLREIYKTVLLLSGVYFYLSIPVMLGTIIAAGCGALAVFFAIGVIPLQLVIIIGILVFATVAAILKSLFVRADNTAPGEPVDLAKHVKLRAMLDEVAAAVGTRPVDVAYFVPGTELGVTERGGVWSSMRGKRSERRLIIGVGLFEGMTQLELRSILAHEYGHFRNQDTAGGGFALAVRRSLFVLIIRLAQAGVATFYNPVWWFLKGFHRMYLGISQGASRLQEVLADRWAIQAYGSAGFIAGYKHVVTRSVAFGHDADDVVKEVIEKRRPLPNLYTYEPESNELSDDEFDAEIEREMVREPTAYDSHPSPRQRIAWAEQLAVARERQPDDDAPVWTLFADRDEVERAMTAEVRQRVLANHGVEILEVAPPGAEGDAAKDREDDGTWKGYSDGAASDETSGAEK